MFLNCPFPGGQNARKKHFPIYRPSEAKSSGWGTFFLSPPVATRWPSLNAPGRSKDVTAVTIVGVSRGNAVMGCRGGGCSWQKCPDLTPGRFDLQTMGNHMKSRTHSRNIVELFFSIELIATMAAMEFSENSGLRGFVVMLASVFRNRKRAPDGPSSCILRRCSVSFVQSWPRMGHSWIFFEDDHGIKLPS